MAEFAVAGDDGGHSWNNALAHATYQDNVIGYGQEVALRLLRENIRSWIREQRGQPHQWSLFVRDRRVVTETGVSLQEMTDNITNGPYSNLVPENIKATAPMEAATIEEATHLAAAGTDRIILPEQHLNQRGEVVARYLSVWTKDTSDPTLYRGSRIDLGKNVRIEDVRTGTSFAAFQDGQALSFHEHREQKHAFVLAVQNTPTHSFESVEKSIIATIHRSHQETYISDARSNTSAMDGKTQKAQSEVQQTRYEVFDKTQTLNAPDTQRAHDVDLFVQVPRAIASEIAETVQGVAVFLRDKEKGKEAISRIFGRENRTANKKGEERKNRPNVQSERLTIEKIREKPVRVVKEIEKRHAEMRQNVAALLVATETKVALGAAPLVLAALAKELPKPVEAVTKSMRRHEKRKLRMKNYELRRKVKRETKKVSVKVQPLRSERVEPLRDAKERKGRKKRRKVYMRDAADGRVYTFEKQKRREKKIGVKRVAVAEKMTPIAPERGERKRKKRVRRVIRRAERVLEAKRVPKKEKTLWVTLAVVADDFVKVASQEVVLRSWMEERPKRRERGAVVGVGVGWMVWMMLNRATVVQERRGAKLIHLPGVQSGVQSRIGSASTPWVLLSIIWYLTAIREHAMRNNPQLNTTNSTNTTNHQMKKSQDVFPEWGVIFVLAS